MKPEHLRRLVQGVTRRLRKPESQWKPIIARSAQTVRTLRSESSGPRILCATSVGSHDVVTTIDGLVATALAVRGAQPHLLLCDEVLPACEACVLGTFDSAAEFIASGPRMRLCRDCWATGRARYQPLPVPLHRYSDFVGTDETARIMQLVQRQTTEECLGYVSEMGIHLGENVRANVLRFYGAGNLEENDPLIQGVARRYLAGAMVAETAAHRAIERIQPVCVVAHHGIYVPQGILGEVARAAGVRVVNWGPSYRNATAIYSHGDTYHRTLMHEPVETWQDMPWSQEKSRRIDAYLEQRRQGEGDWSWMAKVEDAVSDRSRLIDELGLDTTKPTFGLLTNVLYDANLFYKSNAFDDIRQWLFRTIEHFAEHPELQLIIRIHPHEHQGSVVRQRVLPEIEKRWPEIPRNIAIVPSESKLSTYALMDLCQAVLIYGTKTGVELAPTGTPVIVAGEAWLRNKGISIDASSRTEYEAILTNLTSIERSPDEVVERAKKFAYHFFFRRMIPIASLDPDAGWPPRLRIDSLEDIMPGRDPGLDLICDGILHGKPFVYDEGKPASTEGHFAEPAALGGAS